MIHLPPLEEIENLITYIKEDKVYTTSLINSCLVVIFYSKTQVPFGRSLKPFTSKVSNILLLDLLRRVKSENSSQSWIELILPLLKVLQAAFTTEEIFSFSGHSVSEGIAVSNSV